MGFKKKVVSVVESVSDNDEDLKLEQELQTKYKNDISQDAVLEQVKILSEEEF